MNNLVPYMTGVPAPADASFRVMEPDRMSLRQLIGLVLSRAWLGLAVAAVVFLAIVAVGFQMTPKFYAAGSVLIEPRRENLASAEKDQGYMPPDSGAIDTQVEVLRSHALAAAVVRRLELHKDNEFNPRGGGMFSKPTPLPPGPPSESTVSRIADNLMGSIHVRRVGLTSVVQVGATSVSPVKAQRIANEVIDAYLTRQLDTKIGAVRRANNELGTNVEQLRQEAADAEARLQEYKNAHGLLSAQGATMAEMEVSTLNTQIAQAKADTAEKSARLSVALAQIRNGGGGADVGAALNSDTIRTLRDREAVTSIELAQLTARFKADYPEVKKTQAQLDDIRAQIQAETSRIVSSLRAEASAAAQREGSLLASRGNAQGGLAANNRAQVGLVELQQRAEAARTIYEGYLNRAKEVAVEGSLQQADASINSAAALPRGPSSPNYRLVMVFAAMAGLVAAAVTLLAVELWDKRLRNRGDVERRLGVPFAGVLPDFASVTANRKTKRSPADDLVQHPFTGFAEAFRSLRAYLALSEPGGKSKVLAMTSAVPREGKSMSSLCLSRTLAMSGVKVVVVDCDLRKRGVTKLVCNAEVGVTEVIQDGLDLDKALIRDPKTDLWVLPAGTGPVPHDLFSSLEMDKLLKTLSERFDYVILDTPPLLGVADARIIAAKADRVLYLTHWNKTPLRAAQSAVDILHESGANLIGAVLTKVDVRQQARYGYSDSSDYYHYFKNYYIKAA